MIAAQSKVSEFLSASRDYLQCLEQEEELRLAAGTETDDSKSQRDEDYESMLETIKELNEQFLEELEEFKDI